MVTDRSSIPTSTWTTCQMCGIAGFHNSDRLNAEDLRRMIATIKHRGPDSDGVYTCPASGTGLGNTRLAVLDLGPTGEQPMTFEDSGCWITYNGELYNYLELRAELQRLGCQFKTNTDTEVVLAAYCTWGERSFGRFNGMFAFAIYEERRDQLLLCRDQFGIKPLYYWSDGRAVVFGSELKALAAVGRKIGLAWDEKAIRTALQVNYRLEATEYSYLQDARRLLPGYYARIGSGTLTLRRWWCTADTLPSAPARFESQVEHFRELFFDACRIRMRSDVPLGCALSGGIDSSSVVGSLTRMGLTIVPFIHAFPGRWFDETALATSVAAHNGLTPHYVEEYPDADIAGIDAHLYSTEMISPSIMPRSAYRLCAAQRAAGIKVSMEGHGADEMLAGYYWQLASARRDCHPLSPRYRQLLRMQSEMGGPPPARWIRLRGWISQVRGEYARAPANQFGQAYREDLYPEPDVHYPAEWSHLQKQLYHSFHYFTLPQTLQAVDASSMAHGVEIRLPFLDHRLVSFIFSLPDHSKLDRGYTKYVLRQSMRGIVPEAVRTRKRKTPFISPLPSLDLLRGKLRDWSGDVLNDAGSMDGIVDLAGMRKFHSHLLANGTCSNENLRSFYAHLSMLRLAAIFKERFGIGS